MWNPLIKKKHSNELLNFNSRIHVEHPAAISIFQKNLELFLTHLYDDTAQLIINFFGRWRWQQDVRHGFGN